MKSLKILLCLMVLLLVAVPVTADSSTISSVSPTVVYKGSPNTLTITGNFNTSSAKVLLMESGEDSNVSVTSSSISTSEIVCTFSSSKLNDVDTGTRKLVIINDDESESSNTVSISIRSPITLTSISPKTGRANNDSVKVTIVGTGLSDISSFYLYNDEYSNISASSVDPVSSTKVTGTFDLTDKDEATYDVCVKDDFKTTVCDLSFSITSDAVGSIDVSSSPKGATLYVDGSSIGSTPITVDDLDVGKHQIIIKKSGYTDYSRSVKVTNGGVTTVDASLDMITTAPTATSVPTTAPTTIKVTRKSTIVTSTPWPSDTPTTAASPVGTLVVVGAIGFTLIAVRKH
ncbi:PEGA domain-containing protein [Methanoregula sp.]|uniref:PEGA domain-containing protein n=1 Tax=Methanoregula sp. TaxID=2052170 RepID=UPI0023724D1E|nr:PEGA domain-containing protein [Methanoregula sp.]MDD1685460.1 PEGA domain-containing protein [Methanoregula sp.]